MIYPLGVREELDRIVALDPDKLIPEDVAYIRARSYYLEPREEAKFAKVLHPVSPKSNAKSEEIKPEVTEVEEIKETPKPRSRAKK